MKVAIFIDNFFQIQTFKDPGLIAQSLSQLGHQVTIYCYHTDQKDIAIKKITKRQAHDRNFWRQQDFTTIIVYSWLSLRFTKLLYALNQKIILKLDSDGQLIYPFKPTYLRTFGRDNSPKQLLIHLARLIQWTIFAKATSRQRLKQLERCNHAIIESPLALENLKKSLDYGHRDKLIEKLIFIPNPIIPEITHIKSIVPKENIIISVGRFDDKQKNSKGLIKVLKNIDLKDWQVIIIGRDAEKIKHQLPMIQAIEQINHQEISQYLLRSKIFFAPSNHESFNIAAAEALCCDCSLAGTPLESFHYFIAQGKYGTIAKDFTVPKIQLALQTEMKKWETKQYQPDNFWQQELNAINIARQIENIL